MKRVSIGEPTFKVKPYISKRSRNVITESKNDTGESIPDFEASSTSDVKLISTRKEEICKEEMTKCKQHSNVVTSIKWNEKKDSCFVSSSLDKSILIWDVSYRNLSVIQKIEVHEEGVKDVEWTSDGEYLVTASFDKTAKLINAANASCLHSYAHGDLVTRICWHTQNSNIFLSGTANSGVFAWDVRQKKLIKTYKNFCGQVEDLLFLPDGKTFFTSVEVFKRNSMDQTVMAWDFDTSSIMSNQIYQEPYACTSLKLHPNKSCILAQSSAGYIVVFDVSLPWKINKYKRYEGHNCAGYVIGFDTSINGKFIYSGSNDGELFVYNGCTSKLLSKLQVFSSPLTNVACSRAYNSILLSSWEGEVALWE